MTHAHEQPQQINISPIVTVLFSGAFIAILNQTLLVTAIPHIMADLHLLSSTAQWLQTVFMLVNGIMIPITAFLIGRFTTRKLFLTAIGLFAFGTIVCAVSPNFSFLISGRIIQAAGAGIIMPLMQTILFIIFPVEKRGAAMGMFGLVIAFAPAIGPTLSGYIVDHYPWRMLFYIVLPIAIIDFILAYFILKNVTKLTYPKLDVISIMMSTIGFGSLLYGFSIAGHDGWISFTVILTLLIGSISTLIFIIRQFHLKQPILEFRVFQYPIFVLTTAISMIVFTIMISGNTILPIYMQNMLHFSALKSGLMILPGAILMGLMNPIAGRIFDKIGAKWLALSGLMLSTITSFMLSKLSSTTSFTFLTVVYAIRMLSIALVMMPVTTAGLNQLPKHLIPHGTAMNNTMRQIAGSMGTAILFSVMANTQLDTETIGLEGAIHGVNMTFVVTGFFCIVGVIFSLFIQRTFPKKNKAVS